jgi:hypothetical protein
MFQLRRTINILTEAQRIQFKVDKFVKVHCTNDKGGYILLVYHHLGKVM